ncbi:unnamed protein product, partial [Phaeothamnion confervicola]
GEPEPNLVAESEPATAAASYWLPNGYEIVPKFDQASMGRRLVKKEIAYKWSDKWHWGKVVAFLPKQANGLCYDVKYPLDPDDPEGRIPHGLAEQTYNTAVDAPPGSWHIVQRRTGRRKAAPAPGENSSKETSGAAATYAAGMAAAIASDLDPATYEEAMRSSDAVQWRKALESEYLSLQEHGTFEICELPAERKALGCRWVLKKKRNTDGSVARFKARLVAQGFNQQEGVDYVPEELSAPVASMDEVRTALAVGTYFDWEIEQMDIDTAYLNAPVSEEIYMRPPKGFEVSGPDGKPMVWRLRRSLYGLRQSAFNWNYTISNFFKELGFAANPTSPCVFTRRLNTGIVIIILYVDDLLLIGDKKTELDQLKLDIGQRFKAKDLGSVHHLLGMRVTRNRSEGTLKIDQERYICDMLKRFNMDSCNASYLPADTHTTLTKDGIVSTLSRGTEPTAEKTAVRPYQSLVGSLMYAAYVTRLDVANAVRVLARFMQGPTEQHWLAAKRVLRYLAGTRGLGIEFRRGNGGPLRLVGYCDANLAGDLDNGRSTTGVIFMAAGGVVSYASRLQKSVARSTMEAEYMALFEAGQTAVLLRNLLEKLGAAQLEATPLHEDNEACMLMANSAGHTRRSRHIAIRYHYTRELIEDNVIQLVSTATHGQLADGLTKNLPRERLTE